jgi:hypothetical protein
VRVGVGPDLVFREPLQLDRTVNTRFEQARAKGIRPPPLGEAIDDPRFDLSCPLARHPEHLAELLQRRAIAVECGAARDDHALHGGKLTDALP